MGRPKKHKKIEDYPEITELMVKCSQGDPSAIRAVGEFVENVMTGKFGKILELYFRGKETEIVNRAKQDLSNSQFYLGMLDAVKEFSLDLEQFVLDKDKVLEPRRQEEEADTFSPE